MRIVMPTRKYRSLNKRYVDEVSPSEDGENAKRSNGWKRKSSDMLGTQWITEELTSFYDAYRKYGKDWKKLAAAVCGRTSEMVEALYSMNRAYLSLPHGTASAAGLIAMMTDHYSNLGASNGPKSNDEAGSLRKTQKSKRGGVRLTTSKVTDKHIHPQTASSNFGCLPLPNFGTGPRSVGKRTPRLPVSFSHKNTNDEKHFFPTRQGLKINANANDDEVAHEIAKALAKASQKGGSPQVSRTPRKRAESDMSSPFMHDNRKRSRFTDTAEEDLEGSTEADTTDLSRCNPIKNRLDDILEEYRVKEEDRSSGEQKGSSVPSRGKESKTVPVATVATDEDAFAALQNLADLSLMLSLDNEDEAKVQFKDEADNHVDESVSIEALPKDQQKEKHKSSGVRMKERKPKSSHKISSSKSSKPEKNSVCDVSSVSEVNKVPHQSIAKKTRKKQKMQVSKEKLLNCLSNPRLRRWCTYEWFHSAIDCHYYAEGEFYDYLDHDATGVTPLDTLGTPRRFSEQFLKEERDKLYKYRDSARKYYAELPSDSARPLPVGQRVLAIHPKTKELHEGSVLTVDESRCLIQFDRHDLGVESVMDIDCMRSNPFDKFENYNERNGRAKEYMKGSPGDNKIDGVSQFSPLANHTGPLNRKKVSSSNANSQSMGPTSRSQPSTVAQVQAKDADIQAVFELARALDKKEAIVRHLRLMNDDLMENHKDVDGSLKYSEPFKKEYAAVTVQLNEVNEQVYSALCDLRQRNTYQGDLSRTHLLAPLYSCDRSFQTHESGPRVNDIMDTSRTKAQAMVDAATQAILSLKGGDGSIEKVKEAIIDYVNEQLPPDDSSMPVAHESTIASSVEPKIPAELITKCIATLLMIQKCTERQIPPSDVAHILDSAVTSLQPLSSQNLPIYMEIQKCMGIIKSQVMALTPT